MTGISDVRPRTARHGSEAHGHRTETQQAVDRAAETRREVPSVTLASLRWAQGDARMTHRDGD